MVENRLGVLNRAPVDQAAGWLAACDASRQWIDQVTMLRLEKLLVS